MKAIGRSATLAVRGLPLEEDLARVESVNAREHLDQRGFAGSILAEESEHLSLAEIETDILQRIGAAELLMNAPEAKKGWVRRLCRQIG